MIERVEVPRVGCGVSIPLGQITVLVGQNGCGKTTVLAAVHKAVGRQESPSSDDCAAAVTLLNTVLPIRSDRFATPGDVSTHEALSLAFRAKRKGLPVILDALGEGLHPDAQKRLVEALRSVGCQVVAATHSTELLDALDPSEVIVLHDGRWARLSSHPSLPSWPMSPGAGELWRAVGEAWVASLPPDVTE